ncbi:hypothetical protein Tco_1108931 [Tanacetum coccineum]
MLPMLSTRGVLDMAGKEIRIKLYFQIHDYALWRLGGIGEWDYVSMRARKFYQRTRRKIIIDGSNTAGYDKSKVEWFNCHKKGDILPENCRATRGKVIKNIFNGIIRNELKSVREEKDRGLEEFKQPEVNEYGPRDTSVKPTTGYDKEILLHLNDKGFVDSRCSRHMSGNIAHLSDFKEFDGGANGGRITGKVPKATSKESLLCIGGFSHVNFKIITKLCSKKILSSMATAAPPPPPTHHQLIHDHRTRQLIMVVDRVSTAVLEVNTATPNDLVGPSPTSEDTQVEDQEIKLGNISPFYAVSSTPHTRIHKDHPIEHVIGDVQSSVQTRRMKTSHSEKGFLSAIYEEKTHQDLHTCLFAFDHFLTGLCLLSGFMVYQMDCPSTSGSEKHYMGLPSSTLTAVPLRCIIFGSTRRNYCDEFEKLMKDKFQIFGSLWFQMGDAADVDDIFIDL